MALVLKDRLNADVSYILADRRANVAVFVNQGSTLLSRSRITLQLIERQKTNRVVCKLEIPTVLEGTVPGVGDVVGYTEIGSIDLSSVLAADTLDAQNFMAQFASLISSATVKAMFVNGILPNA